MGVRSFFSFNSNSAKWQSGIAMPRDGSHTVFLQAINEHFGGRSKRNAERDALRANLDQVITDRLAERHTLPDGRIQTGFANVLVERSGRFLVSDNNAATQRYRPLAARSKKEVRLHILLQSHLRAIGKHGDVNDADLVLSEDLAPKTMGNTGKHEPQASTSRSFWQRSSKRSKVASVPDAPLPPEQEPLLGEAIRPTEVAEPQPSQESPRAPIIRTATAPPKNATQPLYVPPRPRTPETIHPPIRNDSTTRQPESTPVVEQTLTDPSWQAVDWSSFSSVATPTAAAATSPAVNADVPAPTPVPPVSHRHSARTSSAPAHQQSSANPATLAPTSTQPLVFHGCELEQYRRAPELGNQTQAGNNRPQFRFHGEGDKNGLFSNFWPGNQIRIRGELWPTVEHFFQAQKFESFVTDDLHTKNLKAQIRKEIQRALTPDITKRIARRRCPAKGQAPARGQVGVDWAVWNTRRIDVMYEAVYAKFSQDPVLFEALRRTGDAALVETMPPNRDDDFWGVVVTDSPRAGDARGANTLGRVLMAVREQLANPFSPQAALPGAPADAVW